MKESNNNFEGENIEIENIEIDNHSGPEIVVAPKSEAPKK